MYAMSVSPLRRDMLPRISPRLESLIVRGSAGAPAGEAARGRPGPERSQEGRRAAPSAEEVSKAASAGSLRRERDFTSKIKIGSEVL